MKTKSRAYLDTTILADLTLKTGLLRLNTKSALANYEEVFAPAYAVKEFKRGPLSYVNYLHGKMLDCGNLNDLLTTLSKISRQPNRIATCLDVLGDRRKAALSKTPSSAGNFEKTTFEATLLELKFLVAKSWARINSGEFKIVDDLSCYKRQAPLLLKNGRYELKPTTCGGSKCCMTEQLRKRRFDISKVLTRLKEEISKQENKRRIEVLQKLSTRKNYIMKDADCRKLGDAVFAFYCPPDADILTTNVNDHRPLAEALGKSVVAPQEIFNER